MKTAFGIAASSIALVGAPLMAQANDMRTSAPVTGESSLSANNDLLFYLGIAAVAAGIVLLIDDNDDDEPVSV